MNTRASSSPGVDAPRPAGSEAIANEQPSQRFSLPPEGPAEHLRNALQILTTAAANVGDGGSPQRAVFAVGAAVRRIELALDQVEHPDPRPRHPVAGDPVSGVICDDGTIWEVEWVTNDHAKWREIAPPIPGTVAAMSRPAPPTTPDGDPACVSCKLQLAWVKNPGDERAHLECANTACERFVDVEAFDLGEIPQ